MDDARARPGDTQAAAAADVVVAIPVCNERHHIAGCLHALDTQCGLSNHHLGVVLFLNNCDDGTFEAVDGLRASLSYPLRIVIEYHPKPSAGWARRRAMEAAADWLEEGRGADGLLLTTDADSRVPTDWIARNAAALAAGADLVAGRLALDPIDAAALPVALLARGALEADYAALLIEIGARLDPVPGDPWPTHATHSGASLATRLSTYRRVGGMPEIACGEDRAFVAAVQALGGLVRHDPDIVVVTSGRLHGRAEGGVADTIRARCDLPDSPCDDGLETVGTFVARIRLRRHLRLLHAAGRDAALRDALRSLGTDPRETAAAFSTFGALHAAAERTSPLLAYRPVRPSALPPEIRRARLLLRLLAASRGRVTRAQRPVAAF